jgi:hypothetical protein
VLGKVVWLFFVCVENACTQDSTYSILYKPAFPDQWTHTKESSCNLNVRLVSLDVDSNGCVGRDSSPVFCILDVKIRKHRITDSVVWHRNSRKGEAIHWQRVQINAPDTSMAHYITRI